MEKYLFARQLYFVSSDQYIQTVFKVKGEKIKVKVKDEKIQLHIKE